jgi:hypothetical protein
MQTLTLSTKNREEIASFLRKNFPTESKIWYDLSHTSRSKEHEYFRIFGIINDHNGVPSITNITFSFGFLHQTLVSRDNKNYAKVENRINSGMNIVADVAEILYNDRSAYIPCILGVH